MSNGAGFIPVVGKEFRVIVRVSGEFLRQDERRARLLARVLLAETAEELRGPRGGRYVAVSDLYDVQDGVDTDAYIRDQRVFVASVRGKYVRPSRG